MWVREVEIDRVTLLISGCVVAGKRQVTVAVGKGEVAFGGGGRGGGYTQCIMQGLK